jgi:hypothetical protein
MNGFTYFSLFSNLLELSLLKKTFRNFAIYLCGTLRNNGSRVKYGGVIYLAYGFDLNYYAKKLKITAKFRKTNC